MAASQVGDTPMQYGWVNLHTAQRGDGDHPRAR